MVDQRTRADFKALRETVGMSQQRLADLLGVKVLSVKRWERPREDGYYEPPEEAWEVLYDAAGRQQWAIDTAIDRVHAIEEETGRRPGTVCLTYWRSAEEYRSAHPEEDSEDWQMANANSRIAAFILEREGYTVSFGFISGMHGEIAEAVDAE